MAMANAWSVVDLALDGLTRGALRGGVFALVCGVAVGVTDRLLSIRRG